VWLPCFRCSPQVALGLGEAAADDEWGRYGWKHFLFFVLLLLVVVVVAVVVTFGEER
jgi:nitrate reductase NapE component